MRRRGGASRAASAGSSKGSGHAPLQVVHILKDLHNHWAQRVAGNDLCHEGQELALSDCCRVRRASSAGGIQPAQLGQARGHKGRQGCIGGLWAHKAANGLHPQAAS